jgi:hypothetical protein
VLDTCWADTRRHNTALTQETLAEHLLTGSVTAQITRHAGVYMSGEASEHTYTLVMRTIILFQLEQPFIAIC